MLAQSVTPVKITSGFNWDLVANGAGSAAGSVTGGFDTVSNVFYDSSYLSSHVGGGSGIFPAGSTVLGNSGNQYTLAAAANNNALLLSASAASGTLNLSPTALGVVYILGCSADGSSLVNYTLNFVGGATVSGNFTFSDWLDPSHTGEITGLSRVNMLDVYEVNPSWTTAFSFYDAAISIPIVDQSLALQNISFVFAGGSSKAAVFAVSGIGSVPEPGSAALLTVGIAAAVWFVRRK